MNEGLQPRFGGSASARLENYLHALRTRIRSLIFLRTAAVIAGGTFVLTLIFVAWLAASGFASSIAWSGRLAIGVTVVLALGALLWWPLRQLASGDGAHEFERRLPEQRGRIKTYLDIRRREAEVGASPLTELLAEDAARIADGAPVDNVISKPHLLIPGAIACVCLLALVGLVAFAPGHWGFGSRHLLLGAEIPREAVPIRRIVVSPGDAVVRRNSDLAIRAIAEGFDPSAATVYVRFDDEQQWQRAPMQAVTDDDGRRAFEFKLYALRGPLHYYVAAENAKSDEHGVTVADLPRIDKVRLTYSYPSWTGLEPLTDDTLRGIRAVADTQVTVEVFANAPLNGPTLVIDGTPAPLVNEGDVNVGTIEVKKPGRYHIAARVANDLVPLTEEYPIEIVVDEKPSITIAKPGRDWRATSIEEVPVKVQAQDDFRIQQVELRYSVNGSKWQSVPLGAGNKEIDVSSLLRLEELGAKHAKESGGLLEPGDVISYYAVAKDRNEAVQTDLFMVTVQPFERRFTQASGGGGGGGAGDEQGAISERQREILLATWNLQRSDRRASRTRQQLEENANMLAEMQATLADQARTVAARTRARVSVESDERIRAFVEAMEKAASTMDPAAKHLREFKLDEAVPIEQQALQQLLRAESAFREVQVAMERQNGGGGGPQAARNFTEMFELEMDVEKNQYESQSQLSMDSRKQEVDEALRKLKELAQRQEKLAEEAQRKAMSQQEQRWRQEQLRREAEDLRRQLAELARQENQQGANRQASNQQSGQQSVQATRQSSQTGQSNQRSEVQNALNSLQNALDDMRAANQQNGVDEATRAARGASEKLKRALNQMDRPKEGGALDQEMERFADRSQELAEKQREIEAALLNALEQAQAAGRRRGALDPRSAAEIAEAKQQMAAELERLQREMREAVHKHRATTPAGSRRLGEIVNELESSGVAFRINRSAAEVLYGRARDAAPREGLIGEGLENLERDLREGAALAANDRKLQGTQTSPEELLAQIGELRRALEAARRTQGEAGGTPGERERLAQSEQRDGREQGAEAGDNDGSTGEQTGDRLGRAPNAQANSRGVARDWGGGNRSGLDAWNPATNRQWMMPDLERGLPRTRDARELSEQVEQLANRLGRAQLSPEELRSLQRMAHELRRLAGNPIATNPEAMSKLIDQLELATLSAVRKANPGTPPRTAVQSSDSNEYREAVAEYYRRLGGS
jgi:soluble cytochrome b562